MENLIEHNKRKSLNDLMESGYGNLISKINQLKEEIQADRALQIKEKLERTKKKVQSQIHGILSAKIVEPSCEVPRLGIESALCILNGFLPDSEDQDFGNIHEVIFAESPELPKIQRIPTYTTWIFFDSRNQRMAEDQSVVGRRRIYYDQSGNEALICSDSEDDIAEIEEDKRDFSEGEDRILWMAFQEYGLDDDVADIVSHFIGGTAVEIQERYNELKLKSEVSQEQGSSDKNMFLEKTLSAALDSLDNLFCRRCLVFDCRLHGCSQNLVYPSEKPPSLSVPERRKPCGDQCYLLVRQSTQGFVESLDTRSIHQVNLDLLEGENKDSKVLSIEENVSSDDVSIGCSLESATGEDYFGSASTVVAIPRDTNVAKRKIADDNDRELEDSLDKKMRKIQAIDSSTAAGESVSSKIRKLSIEAGQSLDYQLTCKLPIEGNTTSISNDISSQKTSSSQANDAVRGEVNDINRRLQLKQPDISFGGQRKKLSGSCEWKPLEKDLYVKGLEIFGRNSCLIARNLLSGLKTCSEVSNYMRNSRALRTLRMGFIRSSEDNARADSDNMELLVRSRSKLFRKRGRTRRLKYSSKSNGHPSSWKRIGDGDHSCKQYTPCACEFMCGKDCSCLKNGTCCEKYCGCSKSCKNRFRGCHCAKSQCRSRQCPCFAANRECDPDVCRNCWVSCGGGSLGEPLKRGDGQCGNMRLLLRQQQRILLGRSDIAGWGAFIKNAVNKHDYLGEYTGELVSHREADKRGKIYDRANSSFLFDLNDQYVLDACRQGDKLKFANHSSKPNCYCKVMLVAGDHRVGIFAKERIEAKEELFYDYRYGPDQAPAWARRPEASKKDEFLPSQGRPRKHQSR
ncbi:histone-lysine N-methyltransferase EZA1 isoform X3 [Beta vulgaris subsp. vulgaris]|uniref:histone-lysine N-methyltransferase EZA1 isoform X3 n=1 Tax=Beta vulgaris subsp. vulgaris TaxID=3555 RepID=UPI000900B45B|nr:histone-lysine N-methyltransferase EZA1 isoform X3 [Beta vulgaris subsp. vulgaris]